jgi:hypothetical protein
MAQGLAAKAKGETDYTMIRTRGSRVSRILAAVDICVLLGMLVLFNVFPEKIGIYSSAVQPYVFVPLLTPEWLSYIPWLNTWWGLALTLALIKLVYGRWTQALRWADLGVHLLGICLLASVVLSGPLVGVEPGGSGTTLPSLISTQQHADLLFVGFKSVLGLVLFALIIGFFTKLARLGSSIPVLRLR